MKTDTWPSDGPGVVELPSRCRVRGRQLTAEVPAGLLLTFAVHLSGRTSAEPGWECVWIRWRDFWLPTDPASATEILLDAHARAGTDRVEIGCTGGVGRTGTALAALGVLEGMSPAEAVAWARSCYHRRSVEVPWQRRYLSYVQRFGDRPAPLP